MGEKRFEIKEDDFESLENFPLKWRWTDKKYADLPSEITACINPLKEEKAKEIYSLQSDLVEKNIDENDIFAEDENSLNVQNKETSFVRNWLKTKLDDVENLIFLTPKNFLSEQQKKFFANIGMIFVIPRRMIL